MDRRTAYLGVWFGTAGLAFAMAVAAPNEGSVMGSLPAFMSQTLLRQPLAVPGGLPSDRTLAVITFQRGQGAQAESWIEGLNLRNDPSIVWMRMTVRDDPGTQTGRSAFENTLLQHHPAPTDRAKLVPVFTNQASFVRSAGLNGTQQVYAVVVNRQGEVLARAEGKFDPAKARALRETLKAQEL